MLSSYLHKVSSDTQFHFLEGNLGNFTHVKLCSTTKTTKEPFKTAAQISIGDQPIC